jgi:hypothetical protein
VLTAVALVAGNLVPLVGVVAFGWDLFTLLLVYWLENAIVGASYVARILRAEGEDVPADLPSMSFNDRSVSSFVGDSNRAIAKFFVGHYFGFWVGHGIFVVVLGLTLFGGTSLPSPLIVGAALVSLAASHAYSYRVNFVGRGEYERLGPVRLMIDPYRRVIVLHVTIVLGAFAVELLGTPVGALVVMVLMKIAVDLRAHWREHVRAQRGDATPTTEPGRSPTTARRGDERQ